MKISSGIVLLCFLILGSISCLGAETEKFQLRGILPAEKAVFHIALNGNDQWSGKLSQPNNTNTDGPFRTFQRGQSAVRTLSKSNTSDSKAIIVEVHSGLYELEQPLYFTDECSGTAQRRVIWRVAAGEEVRLVGGRFLNGFTPIRDESIRKQLRPEVRDKVLQYNLKENGIENYGSPAGGGLELFFKNKPMHLSRYPNNKFMTITGLGKEGTTEVDIRGTKGIQQGIFQFDDEQPLKWNQEEDIWVYGYWFWDWAAQAQQVVSIESNTKLMTLKAPWHSYGYRLKQWFYAYNLLCEIDEPCEFYIDRKKGILYFYPPENIQNNDVLISMNTQLVSMKNVSYLTFAGFVLEACRNDAITIQQGDHVEILGCTIRNVGGTGIVINGKNQLIFGCHLYQTGCGGIVCNGGDRTTLTPGKMAVVNNYIHDYGRIQRIYASGIQVGGVGNYIGNNTIKNAPHMAIGFGGNDHLIERNEIANVCFESNDAGAIYTGRNWTMRGNVLKNNYLHDIKGFQDRGCVGIYLDDMFSSADIVGNLFVRVTRAAFIGGGRDNSIQNNIFIDCTPALHIDARALGWAHDHADGWIKEAQEKKTISGIKWNEPPYSTKYPALAKILEGQPKAPEGNTVTRNICFGGSWDVNKKGQWQGSTVQKEARSLVSFKNNLVDIDPLFVNAEKGDYRLRPESPALKLGFEPIPFDKIGIYADPLSANK